MSQRKEGEAIELFAVLARPAVAGGPAYQIKATTTDRHQANAHCDRLENEGYYSQVIKMVPEESREWPTDVPEYVPLSGWLKRGIQPLQRLTGWEVYSEKPEPDALPVTIVTTRGLNHLIATHLAAFWAWTTGNDGAAIEEVDGLVEQYMDEHDLELGGQSYHCSEHALETDLPLGCKDCSEPARYARPHD